MAIAPIDAETQLFCVLGNPVTHSLSPCMHNAAFWQTGYSGLYVALRVQDIGAAIGGIRSLGIRGASITIPHKVTALDHLDVPDDAVLRIGAVNTLVNDRGTIRGYNSDAPGAVRALTDKSRVDGRHAVIVGAGGAARAVAYGLLGAGARVTVVNRGRRRGEGLASDLGVDFVPLEEVERLHGEILINTTPVGMSPSIDRMPVPPGCLKPGMVVMDVIYNPVRTRLLETAAACGCLVVDGVEMFVYQGAIQFEHWTGLKAPLETMRQAVIGALGAVAPETAAAGES